MDQDLIDEAVKASLNVPFAWGSNDCCTFVCDLIAKASKTDPMAAVRGTYATEKEALAIASSYGGLVEMVQFLARASGFKTVAWPFDDAAFGIIAGINGPMMALWVVDKWVARGTTGSIVTPRRSGVLAWRIK